MWKLQLTIAINFISSKNVEEERVMHSKSNNIEFIPDDKKSKPFESLLSRYQSG